MSRRHPALAFALGVIFAATAGGEPAIRITLLGTGNPRPSLERSGPAILVEAAGRRLLFDCGRGTTERLFELDRDLSRVTALFLTHLHSDHVVGIPDLWLTGWIFGRNEPLRVWGPPGTRAMMENLEKAFSFDVHMRRDVDERLNAEGVKIEATEIGEGVVLDQPDFRVTAFVVDHGLVKPALGYRIDASGRSVVLSGDTRPSENLVRFARGCDVLIHEVISPDEERTGAAAAFTPEQRERIIAHHSTPEEAGKIFARVSPRLAVYSHIVPSSAGEKELLAPTRKNFSGPLEVGQDGMTIEIGERVTVTRRTRNQK